MSNGTLFTVKQDLLDAIRARVYTNSTFDVSADDIETNDEDLVESLWDRGAKFYEAITHAELTTRISNSTLIPSALYKVPFETRHLIYGTTLANTQATGYTPIIEDLFILATGVNTISESVVSLQYPQDIIKYSAAVTAVGSGTPVNTQGTIYYRKDGVRNIETFFNFRNRYVVRYDTGWAALTQVGAPSPFTGTRGDLTVATSEGSTSVRSFMVTPTGTANPGNLTDQFCPTSAFLGQYPAVTVSMFSGAALPKVNTPLYKQAITGTVGDIFIGPDCADIYVDSSKEVYIAKDCTGISISNCKGIKIGSDCVSIMMSHSIAIELGYNISSFVDYSSYNVSVGYSCSNIFLGNNQGLEIGIKSAQVLMMNSMRSSLGNEQTQSVFHIFNEGTVGNKCSNISAGNSMGTEIQDRCSGITTIGGNYNLFEVGCKAINVDNRSSTTGDSVGYNSYAPMEHCHFGRGCEDIVFWNPSGTLLASGFNITSTTFGAQCKKLTFSGSVSMCRFERNIENKTFTSNLAGIVFATPDDTPAVIGDADFTGVGVIVDIPNFNVTGNAETVNLPSYVADTVSSTLSTQRYGKVFRWNMGMPQTLGLSTNAG